MRMVHWKVFAVSGTHRKREARAPANLVRILPLFVVTFPRKSAPLLFPNSFICLFEKTMAGKEGSGSGDSLIARWQEETPEAKEDRQGCGD